MNSLKMLMVAAIVGLIGAFAGEAKGDFFDFSYTGKNGTPTISGKLIAHLVSGNQYEIDSATVTALSGDPQLSAAASAWSLDTSANPQYIYKGQNPLLGNIDLVSSNTLETIALGYRSTGPLSQRGYSYESYNASPSVQNGTNSYNGTMNVTPVSTPEPTSLALIAAGAPCMMLVRRLRRKQAAA